jgi:hypothetical protein
MAGEPGKAVVTGMRQACAAVMAVAVAGIGVVIWLQGTIAARDIAGTLISAVIFACWVHLLVIAHQDSSVPRDWREPVEKNPRAPDE